MTPGFERRRAWETYRALLGPRLYTRGRLLPAYGVIFPLVICPELFFTHTFSIHAPLLPPIHSHIHSGSRIPQSAVPPSFLIPSFFPHWVTNGAERWLAGEVQRHLAQHQPCPSLLHNPLLGMRAEGRVGLPGFPLFPAPGNDLQN